MALRYENLSKAGEGARKRHAAAWGSWIAGLAKAGKLEAGYPLEAEGKRVSSAGAEEYRFPDSTEGGFMIIRAGSAEEAAEIARTSPIIENGGYVLVRPCGEMKQ